MKDEIQKLNEWLEQQAIKFENDEILLKYKKEHPEFQNSWPSYYRKLKDIHLKDSFMITSGDGVFPNPLRDYVILHKEKYNATFFTGSAIYVKKVFV